MHLDKEAVKELLDQGIIKELLNNATRYGVPCAEANDQRVTKEHERVEGKDHHAGANAGRNEEKIIRI